MKQSRARSAGETASATLVVRDFFMRWKPGLRDQDQVVIERRITVLMAVLGVLAAPLVGLSVAIWHYLQMLSAYLGAPLGAVIFVGLLWKRGNTAGAIAGGAARFAFGLFLFLAQEFFLLWIQSGFQDVAGDLLEQAIIVPGDTFFFHIDHAGVGRGLVKPRHHAFYIFRHLLKDFDGPEENSQVETPPVERRSIGTNGAARGLLFGGLDPTGGSFTAGRCLFPRQPRDLILDLSARSAQPKSSNTAPVHKNIGNADVPLTRQYTEYLTQVVKDFQRSVDYLETRRDIDSRRLAYLGFSWGGNLAPLILSTEDRVRASVLVVGGMWGLGRPETQEINYVSRVRVPTLMLNGKYDMTFALDTEVKPMFDLLGTPAGQKQLRVYESDHFIPRNEVIKETLAWLDRYLGPVK